MAVRTAGTGFSGTREPKGLTRKAAKAESVRTAAPGGMPFNPPHCQGRTKNDTPCKAKRANGTLFCVGHLRARGELGL